jgi:uncharacterized protein YjbI with pentapeptide repeats
MNKNHLEILNKNWADGLYEHIKKTGDKINLHGVDFTTFSKKRFETSGIFDLKLIEADLSYTLFNDFDFSYMYLTGSYLNSSTFKNCNFKRAILASVDFTNAKLINCNIDDANFNFAKVDINLYNILKDDQKKKSILIHI